MTNEVPNARLHSGCRSHLLVDDHGVSQNLRGVGKEVLIHAAIGGLVRVDEQEVLGRAVEAVAAVVRVPLFFFCFMVNFVGVDGS